jgi:hypothetical protein
MTSTCIKLAKSQFDQMVGLGHHLEPLDDMQEALRILKDQVLFITANVIISD